MQPLALALLPSTFAICQLNSDAPIPAWANSKPFCSITRTANELSIVCLQSNVPDGIQSENNFRCLQIVGKFDFSEIGILASLAATLANASVSILTISTFDTDYLLVKQNDLNKAVESLRQAGYRISDI